MSTAELGSGALFKNDNATTENKQPQYRGFIKLDGGQEMDIAAWLRTAGPNTKNPGSTFMSLKIQEKWVAPNTGGEPAPQGEFEDDIPF